MRKASRRLSTAITLISLTTCASAAAADPDRVGNETLEASSEPYAPQPAVEAAAGAPWKEAFEQAVRSMQEGRYRHAEAMFARLAATATSAEQRSSALQHRETCAYWGSRELVVVPAQRSLRKPSARELGWRTQDEMAVLYTHAVLWGLGSGVVLASHREPTNFAELALPTVAATGAAIGAVAVADAGEPLGYGVGQSIASGMQIGFAEAAALVAYHQAVAPKQDDWSGGTAYTLLWGGATFGAVAGGTLGATVRTTPGRAAFVASTAAWTGALAGTATAALNANESTREEHGALGAAIGLNAGLLAGSLAAAPISPSQRRVRYVDIGGVMGGLGGIGVFAAVADGADDDRPLWGLIGAGTATGLTIAWIATSSMPEDRPRETSTFHAVVSPTAGGAALRLGGSW